MSVETFTNSNEPASLPPTRLWFGFLASAAAWLMLGTGDLLLVWNECAHQQQYSGEGAHPISRFMCSAVSIAFLLIAIAGGTISYLNWRILSHQQNLLETKATERREFLALVGVIISITLGMGIVWLSIPPLLIQFCQRAK